MLKATIAAPLCAAFRLAGLGRTIFVAICLASVWLFLIIASAAAGRGFA